jgi:hypothetical protein
MEPAFEALEGRGGGGLLAQAGDELAGLGPLEAEPLSPGFVDETLDRRPLAVAERARTSLGDEER